LEERVFGLGCEYFDDLSYRYLEVDGSWVVELDITDDLRGPAGSVHGGIVATLIDVAGAASVARATHRPVATATTSIQYLAAGREGPLRANVEVLRASDALAVVEVKVVDRGRDDRLVAAAHITMRVLGGDDYVRKT
jgi:acyl-CoA thioesterase